MKKLNSLLIILMSLMVISCGDKELSEDIIGTWVLESDVYTCDDPADNETDTYSAVACDGSDADCEYVSVAFTETNYTVIDLYVDSNGEVVSDTATASYTIANDSITIVGISGGVSIDGDQMIFTSDEDDCLLTSTFNR